MILSMFLTTAHHTANAAMIKQMLIFEKSSKIQSFYNSSRKFKRNCVFTPYGIDNSISTTKNSLQEVCFHFGYA